MEPLKIEIQDLGLDTVIGPHYPDGVQTLGEAIVAKAAANLTQDGEYGEVMQSLRRRIAKIRDDEIRDLVRAELAKAMAEPVTQTNSYGESIGQPTALRALIVDAATKFFSERGDYGRGATQAQKLVAQEVQTALTKELREVMAEEKAKVVAVVQAKAAELLAEAVKQGLR